MRVPPASLYSIRTAFEPLYLKSETPMLRKNFMGSCLLALYSARVSPGVFEGSNGFGDALVPPSCRLQGKDQRESVQPRKRSVQPYSWHGN
jgi:hypothetical protein